MEIQLILGAIGGATLVVVGGLVWMRVQQQTALERLDDRMAHLLAGVSLLTDTTESALRDVAAEINRLATLADDRSTRPRVATQRRVTSAIRRGRSVPDIAADEQISEGEVRLRLQLDNAREERLHAPVR